MDVSIIIVNYNTRKLLCDCLRSIGENTFGLQYEVIIVDNASSDDSRIVVEQKFPWVKWIQSPTNLGFGKANNLGAKAAVGKYLFLLNSDTIILNNAVKIFYEWHENHESDNYGVIGAPLFTSEMLPNTSAGYFIRPWHVIQGFFDGLIRLVSRKERHFFQMEEDVEYVNGADMFVNRQLFNHVNGFDDDYFMYCEEVDLQLRISKLGYRNHLINGPEIIHLDGASFGKSTGLSLSRFTMWQTSRNLYAKKHFGRFERIFWKCSLILFGPSILIKQNWSLSDKIRAYKLMLK